MRILAATLLCVACSSHVDSDVTVNGKKLVVESCRNGVVYGYRGVEVTSHDVRLRIALSESGAADLAIMVDGDAKPRDVGACGTLVVGDQHSSVDNVTNVEGHADLDCATAGFTVKGTVKFENCH